MRERGAFEAGREFLRHGGAADHFATLEHERPESRFGEIKGGN
jgi:hypothetical protein